MARLPESCRARRVSRRARVGVRTGLAKGLVWLSCSAAVISGSVLAQATGGPYSLTRSTIDSGGGRSSAGIYAIHGTIGQPDAHTPLTGGPYLVQPGFWVGKTVDGGAPLPDPIFSDGFEGP